MALNKELSDPDTGDTGGVKLRNVDPNVPLEDQLDEAERAEVEGHETPDDKANRGNKSTKPQTRSKKEEPEAREFKIAHSVGPIAKLLISDHFPELSQLDIRYVFTTKASEIDGKVVIAKPSKVAGLNAWLGNGMEDGEANPFFVVVISESHWSNMPARGKEAFLDSALASMTTNKKSGALKMQRPDICEHSKVLARHGLYSAELKGAKKDLEKAVLQPGLAMEEGGG